VTRIRRMKVWKKLWVMGVLVLGFPTIQAFAAILTDLHGGCCLYDVRKEKRPGA